MVRPPARSPDSTIADTVVFPFVPETTPVAKRDRLVQLGARVVVGGAHYAQAAEACVAKIPQALQENPPVGKAGLFVRELEALVKDTPRNQAAIQEWLMSQPLFRAMTKTPEAFANLEIHYQECAPKMNQIIQSANESLTSLLQQQSQGQQRPGAQFRPM